MPAWTAIDLSDVRTETLQSIDLRHGPPAAVLAVRQELAARRNER